MGEAVGEAASFLGVLWVCIAAAMGAECVRCVLVLQYARKWVVLDLQAQNTHLKTELPLMSPTVLPCMPAQETYVLETNAHCPQAPHLHQNAVMHPLNTRSACLVWSGDDCTTDA